MRRRMMGCFGGVLGLMAFATQSGELLVKDGEKVAFLGDSITEMGGAHAGGYVRLVELGLEANGVKIQRIGAGKSGNKSNDMLARLDTSVLNKKADWMTLSCGVNDVWHGERGVSLEDYKKNIAEILRRAKEAGVRVLVMTATPIKEQDNAENRRLADYNAFLRETAAAKQLPLADCSAAFWREIEQPTRPKPPGHYLTSDGVHMNVLGNMLMAETVLRVFGMDEEQLGTARAEWRKREGAQVNAQARLRVGIEEFEALSAQAAQAQKPLSEYLTGLLAEAIQQSLQRFR